MISESTCAVTSCEKEDTRIKGEPCESNSPAPYVACSTIGTFAPDHMTILYFLSELQSHTRMQSSNKHDIAFNLLGSVALSVLRKQNR